jgi:transcriptional regulator with XRE-family HTH domain
LPSSPDKNLGRRIRALRQEQGITLQKLAEQTRLSKSLLSKIENGKVSSPVSTLFLIAQSLGAKITDFFEDREEDQPLILVRKGERPHYGGKIPHFGYEYEALASKRRKKLMEPFILTVGKRVARKVFFTHSGEEILFVLKGTMEFHYGGQKWVVREGDCVYFDASIPHVGVSANNELLKVFMVISPGSNENLPERLTQAGKTA